jgi:hypothetical protein
MINSNKCVHFSLLGLILLLLSCVASQPQNSLNFDLVWNSDQFTDDPSVGLVQLLNTQNEQPLRSPVVLSSTDLLLNFDLLVDDFQYLSMKIFHCNSDWKRSLLRDLEFLEEYNEFPVREYQFSQTNYEAYTNYSIRIPSVTKSGNYVLVVYDEDINQILFARRFSVYEPIVQSEARIERPNSVVNRNSFHQISYEINYGSLNVIDPLKDIQTFVIQNQNWENSIDHLTPSQIRQDRSELIYESFNNENLLPAWNEFRFFDTRRLANRGLRVINQYQSDRGAEVFLEQDNNRGAEAYSEPFQQDLNGLFKTENIDLLESDINSEYTYVHFDVISPQVNGQVYVTGRFNNWQKTKANQLLYNESKGSYQGDLLFKQGYYNYRYEVVSDDLPEWYLEGSHFQTRNQYELLVYFREPGTVYDQLVGYAIF